MSYFENFEKYDVGEELYETLGIACPYCGYINDDLCDYSSVYEDGAINEFICYHCDRKFEVQTSVSITWITTKAEIKESEQE